ncbi:MAG: adenosylmethionine decarboxylase [Candidatus Moraniibacteriota bacterium]|nr:MAG: adenosylmethionine decarboxylase [Candidatus Moranbacteria bacterium]
MNLDELIINNLEKYMETINFGEHLMIDGYGGNFEKLNDEESVRKCLDDLVVKCEMHKLTETKVFFAKGNDTKDPGGWSGYVLIEESHISIHTFPGRGFLSADVYTCKNDMETDLIISHITEIFQLKETEINFVKRGTRYPSQNLL